MVSVAFGHGASGAAFGTTDPRGGKPREVPLAEPLREPASVTLQVSGGKPLRLRGVLLAEGNSWAPGTVAWHEVALWRCEEGEVAVAVRTLRKAQGETDMHRAELFPNLTDALGWLEEFDPTQDLSVDLDASDRALSAIEIALRAAALRGRADEVARQWRALLGEMLFRLDAGA